MPTSLAFRYETWMIKKHVFYPGTRLGTFVSKIGRHSLGELSGRRMLSVVPVEAPSSRTQLSTGFPGESTRRETVPGKVTQLLVGLP
jgi:hypothetical protein